MDLIERGQVYWLREPVEGKEVSGVSHPHVVLQETEINMSRVETVVVCAISTNRNRAFEVGNVLLEAGEAGLPKQSFVAVGHVSAVPKEQLGRLSGKLTEDRVREILHGISQRARFSVLEEG